MENFKPENLNSQPPEEKPKGLANPYLEGEKQFIFERMRKYYKDFNIFSEEVETKYPDLTDVLRHPEKYDSKKVDDCLKISDELLERIEAVKKLLKHLEDKLAKLNFEGAKLRTELLGSSMITGDKEPESTEGFVMKKDISGSSKFNQN